MYVLGPSLLYCCFIPVKVGAVRKKVANPQIFGIKISWTCKLRSLSSFAIFDFAMREFNICDLKTSANAKISPYTYRLHPLLHIVKKFADLQLAKGHT
jgi:hypothetical protein